MFSSANTALVLIHFEHTLCAYIYNENNSYIVKSEFKITLRLLSVQIQHSDPKC